MGHRGVMVTVGAIFRPSHAPEELVPFARAAEDAGLDQLWLWEDSFYHGGISTAATALTATRRISVGIGVLPVPLRNVALTAMEIATLDRLHPGRLVPGIGHGIQGWMAQAGVRATSPMTLLREYTSALQRLLAGEEVTVDGDYVRLDGVRLTWPPPAQVRLHLAGEGPRTLELVGSVGDGLVVPGGYDTTRLREVVATVAEAAARAGRDRVPEITVFLPCAFGPDGWDRIVEARTEFGVPSDAEPREVWGDPSDVAEGVATYAAAGADAVALQPVLAEPDPAAFFAPAAEVASLVRAG